MENKNNSRLEWIDFLRGIAACMVMIFHFWNIIYNEILQHFKYKYPQIINLFINGIFDFGKIGVIIFFAISGVVIPYSLIRHKENNIKKFIISRIFRLYPLYWTTIIITIILASTHFPIKQIFANLTMLQKFVGINNMVGVFWTLQIELIFYFLCVILFFLKLIQKDKTILHVYYILLISSGLLAFVRYITEIKLPVALTLGLSVMFLGMLSRKYFLNEKGITKKAYILNVFLFILCLFPISLLAYNKDYGYDEKWYKYFISYLLAVLLFTIIPLIIKSIHKAFLFLGKISYSIYLIHATIGIYVVEKLINRNYFNPILIIFIASVFVIIISSITYNFIEKPFINVSRYINNNLFNIYNIRKLKIKA